MAFFGNIFSRVGRALSAIGIDTAGEFLGREASEAIRTRAKEMIFEGPRRDQLLSEFRRIPRRNLENMWRRHREALEAHRENRFCTLLLKVPKEERADMYQWLDRLTEEEFEQALAMLANDVIPQFAKYVIAQLTTRGERLSAASHTLRAALRTAGVATARAGHALDGAVNTALDGLVDGWKKRERID